jgi:hypothetical protein
MVWFMSRSDTSAAQDVRPALVEFSRLEAALAIHDGRAYDDLAIGICARLLSGRRGRLRRCPSRLIASRPRSGAAAGEKPDEAPARSRSARRNRWPDHHAVDELLHPADGTLLANFAAGLRRDFDAVKAALKLRWTTSPVGGQNSRLKILKRDVRPRWHRTPSRPRSRCRMTPHSQHKKCGRTNLQPALTFNPTWLHASPLPTHRLRPRNRLRTKPAPAMRRGAGVNPPGNEGLHLIPSRGTAGAVIRHLVVKYLIHWEIPRLCRGGSRSLTFPGIVPGCPSTKLQSLRGNGARVSTR